MKYDYNAILSRKDLSDIINDCTTFADIMRRVGLPVRGKMGITLKKKLLENGYDLSHLTGIPKFRHKQKTLEEYLTKNSTAKSCKIKNILFKHGIKTNKCEVCGIENWNGKPLNMQLHHIDGDPTNNTLENLQILCPNCHAQTDTYCCKKPDVVKEKEIYICPMCGGEKKTKKSQYCSKCSSKLSRKVEWPTKEEMENYLLNGLSLGDIGKLYNVSGNAVKKWKIYYNL